MKKNDEIVLNIEDTALSGDGVGHVDGLAVFVPATVKGDTVKAHVLKVKSNLAFAKLTEVITPSKDRVKIDCGTYYRCGGCSFRHISYETEAAMKENAVKNNLLRIGKVNPEFEKITVLNPDGYRNKCQYPVSKENGEIKIGFFSTHSHRVTDCPECRLQPECFSKAVAVLKSFIAKYSLSVYSSETGKGLIRHLYLRRAEATGEILVCLVINGEALPHSAELLSEYKCLFGEDLKSFVLNVNTENTNVILGKRCLTLYGNGYITDILCGVKVRISPLSFYQVNHGMAELLYKKAAEYAEPDGKTVLDLYCGAGTIGLSMANKARSVVGVEIVPEAIVDAKFNAAENGFYNTRFICGDAASSAKQLEKEGIKADTVILDPPRKGCDEELIKTVALGFAPERIVYVSCDSATLSRDCKIFSELGYETVKAAPFDLFPRTSHVESVCLLSKVNTQDGSTR